MSFATIDDLRSQLGGSPQREHSAAYIAKMMHPLPASRTVDREAFIVKHCEGKRVLDVGASGRLADRIRQVASLHVGLDRTSTSDDVVACDLDDVTRETLPVCGPFDLVVCGEVLEHLSNPGWFLTRLKRQCPDVPVIITVPNAFSAVAARWALKGTENVNSDHVAWYSPTTIGTLLLRVGYKSGALYYYNGDGPTAEGLIVCTE